MRPAADAMRDALSNRWRAMGCGLFAWLVLAALSHPAHGAPGVAGGREVVGLIEVAVPDLRLEVVETDLSSPRLVLAWPLHVELAASESLGGPLAWAASSAFVEPQYVPAAAQLRLLVGGRVSAGWDVGHAGFGPAVELAGVAARDSGVVLGVGAAYWPWGARGVETVEVSLMLRYAALIDAPGRYDICLGVTLPSRIFSG